MPASLIVNIDVPSLDAGIAFYTKAFEFRLCRFLFDKSVAELESALGRLPRWRMAGTAASTRERVRLERAGVPAEYRTARTKPALRTLSMLADVVSSEIAFGE
jgi:hypothetical protein